MVQLLGNSNEDEPPPPEYDLEGAITATNSELARQLINLEEKETSDIARELDMAQKTAEELYFTSTDDVRTYYISNNISSVPKRATYLKLILLAGINENHRNHTCLQ